MTGPVVGVIGGGDWGIALATAAARTGTTTLLLSRRARDGALPTGVVAARDEADIGERARLIILAVPSAVAREVARKLGGHVDGRHFVVHGVRGLVGRPDGVGGAHGGEEPHPHTIPHIVPGPTPLPPRP